MDPKKRFPREDKNMRLMADIKIPVRHGKAVRRKAKAGHRQSHGGHF